MTERTRFDLSPDRIPAAWLNLLPVMVGAGIQPLPPLLPGTTEPVTPDLLAPLFPEQLIMQEVSTEEWIDVPGEVLDIYRLW
ncbi:MAG: TrpB-like pyridoxal phosphate-dependent enzyme, partial [Actinomycetota bacterium]